MQPVVYVDLRALQDENYRVRGIGHHVAALLRARRKSAFSSCRTIGLVDSQLPQMLPEFRALVDEITYSTNPCLTRERAVFVDGSPMGHDSRFTARLANHPAFLKAVVIYDFIPFDWPGYLPTVTSRIDYFAKLARLKNFDLFFPISEYSAQRAIELLGIPRSRTVVTGAAVRRAIYECRRRITKITSPYDRSDPYFFITYGGDIRKNIEIAIKALGYLNMVHGRRMPLKIAGHYDLKGAGYYDQEWKRNLLRLAGTSEGEGFLEFFPGVSDEELVSLYSGAIATIVPSHIEGFSLPVIEASVCGCPVVASTCAAHLELIDQPEALFDSNDVAVLCGRLDRLLNDPNFRESLKARQAHLGSKFHEDLVGRLFWNGLEELTDRHGAAPAIGGSKKARLAFLSAFPPDQGESAVYTANAMRAGEGFFCADVYTNAARPLTFEGRFRDAGRISRTPILGGSYDGIVSVIGDSYSDADVASVLHQYGGPCILHDSSQFLESIVARARPLMVHTATQQIEIMRRYEVDGQLLPCCPRTLFRDEELAPFARVAARERLGIPADLFLISSFGTVSREKGMHTCIAALDLLRMWNIPAQLYFVGEAKAEAQELNRISSLYGIEAHVHVVAPHSGKIHDFLIASNGAVQVRNSRLARPCTALMDCISAGLPCVATRHMAVSCDAPAYVQTVTDRFSPLQVAEQLALIWDSHSRRDHRAARAAYLEKHNFRYYAQRLVEILGIA